MISRNSLSSLYCRFHFIAIFVACVACVAVSAGCEDDDPGVELCEQLNDETAACDIACQVDCGDLSNEDEDWLAEIDWDEDGCGVMQLMCLALNGN